MFKNPIHKILILIVLVLSFNIGEAGARKRPNEVLDPACLTSNTISTNITADTKLCLNNSPYTVTTGITISSNAKLTVEPGVVVKFNSGASLTVGENVSSQGSLYAKGTSNQPIRFTSSAPSPAPGDWGSIHFTEWTNLSQTKIDHIIVEYGDAVQVNAPIRMINSTFRYSQGFGIMINNVSPEITNNTFSNNMQYPITFNGEYASPILKNNTFIDNMIEGIAWYGNVWGPVTLTKDNTFYVVNYLTDITHGGKLTIEPGVVMKFAPLAGLIVGFDATSQGALHAQGTEEEPIVFTSLAVNPAPGDWGIIQFSADGTNVFQSKIDHIIVEYGGWTGLHVTVPIQVTNSTFRYNQGPGMVIENASPKIANNTFSNNMQYPVWILGDHGSPVLRNNTYFDNMKEGISWYGYLVNGSITLTKDNTFYVVSGQRTISNGAKLTIEPGVVITFEENAGLTVGYDAVNQGALDAQGTDSKPIVFTSNEASPAPGDWGSIQFTNGTNVSQTRIDHIIVEYAGFEAVQVNTSMQITNSIFRYNQGYAMVINNVSPKIANNTFSNNMQNPIWIRGEYASPVLRNNSYTDNMLEGIIWNDHVYGPVTITKDNTFYAVYGQKIISGGAKLTIEPGVVIKFESPSAGIIVGDSADSMGALDAQGTANEPITFSSNRASPAPGDWGYIRFTEWTNVSQTNINHIIVEYAGFEAVQVNAPIQITNSVFRYNQGHPMVINNVSPKITNNTFSNNQYPIWVLGEYASPVLRNNTYIENTNEGILWDGHVYGSVTMTKDNTFYVVYSQKIIAEEGKLKIEPGVVIKFGSSFAGITVGYAADSKGALDAQGTASEPIVFTSNAVSPSPGNWNSIQFTEWVNVPQTKIDHIIVEYGNASAVQILAPIAITNSIFRHNQGNAIGIINTSASFWGNIFQNNSFSGGIINFSEDIVKAEANWWGHASGPSGSGPGTGEYVSDHVEYEPWRGEVIDPQFTFTDVSISPKKFNQTNSSTRIFTDFPGSSGFWHITIKNDTGTVVKNFLGPGNQININWHGDDNSFLPLPNGVYTYTILAYDVSTPDISLIGHLTLDNTIPTAKITSPEANDFLANSVEISGSAEGTNFASYVLEYGQGNSPSTWTTITSSATPVHNGVLGNWTIPEIDTPVNRIRLRVLDNLSNVYVDEVPVQIFSIHDVRSTPNAFSPNGDGVNDTTTISAGVTFDSNSIITIKNSVGATVNSLFVEGSNISRAWNGLDANGNLQPDGNYTFQIQATASSLVTMSEPMTVTIDNTLPTAQITHPTSGNFSSGMNVVGTANDANFKSYELQYGIGTAPYYSWFPLATGTVPVNNGVLGVFNTGFPNGWPVVIRLVVYDLAGNIKVSTVSGVIQNTDESINIDRLDAEASQINPIYSEVSTINYSLTGQADVTVRIIDPTGNSWVIDHVAKQTPDKIHSIIWDGKNSSGKIVSEEGDYQIEITAEDPVSKIKNEKSVSIKVVRPSASSRLADELVRHQVSETSGSINVSRGEFILNKTDIAARTFAAPFEIKRTYGSQQTINGPLGYGWHFNFYVRLQEQSNNNIVIVDGETGHVNEFIYNLETPNVFNSPAGIYEQLMENEDGTYTLNKRGGTKYEFDVQGKLLSIADRNNHATHFKYAAGKQPIIGHSEYFVSTTNGILALDYQLIQITDSAGRDYQINYNKEGRISSILDYAGRVWTYTYEDDHLKSSTTPSTTQYPSGMTTVYTYDADHNLETVTDPKGQTYLTNHYDSDDRISSQDFGTGTASMSYNLDNNKTTVTDFSGYVTEWTFDAMGHPTERKDFTKAKTDDSIDTYTTKWSYNLDMEITQIINPTGNGTVFVYDSENKNPLARRNLLQIRQKSDVKAQDDAKTDTATNFTYEPQYNQINTITDTNGNTTYTYDENGNVTKIERQTASGIQTTDITYNIFGLIETITDPLNRVTTYGYDNNGNRTSILDHAGSTTLYKYDEHNFLFE